MHFDPGELAAIGGLFAVVCAAIGGALVKFWPVLTQSRVQRAAAAAQIQLDSEAAEAKRQHDAHEQVAQEYQEMIDRQQKQMDQQAAKLDTMNADMRTMLQAHADCLVTNQALQGRLAVVEAKLERVTTTQAVADIPTRAEAVIVTDQEGTIREWNQAATVLFHWRGDEAVGMDVRKLIPPRYLPLHDSRWQEVLRTGRPVRRGPFIIEALTKDGAKIAIEMILSGWIENGDGAAAPVAFFSASIRKLPVDPRGRVLERGGYRPLPIPEPNAAAAAMAEPGDSPVPGMPQVSAQVGPQVSVRPGTAGGSVVSAPAGSTISVRADGLSVEATGTPPPHGDTAPPPDMDAAEPDPQDPKEPHP